MTNKNDRLRTIPPFFWTRWNRKTRAGRRNPCTPDRCVFGTSRGRLWRWQKMLELVGGRDLRLADEIHDERAGELALILALEPLLDIGKLRHAFGGGDLYKYVAGLDLLGLRGLVALCGDCGDLVGR